MSFELEINDTAYSLAEGIIIVGRKEDNDISIPVKSISGTHSRFTVQGGQVWVEDLGSTNGTWVNGSRIDTKTEVKSGDTIRLGKVDGHLKADEPAPPAPAPVSSASASAPARRKGRKEDPIKDMLVKGVVIGIVLLIGFMAFQYFTAPDPRIAAARAVMARIEEDLKDLPGTDRAAADECRKILDGLDEAAADLRGLDDDIPEIGKEYRRLSDRILKLRGKAQTRLDRLGSVAERFQAASHANLSALERVTALKNFLASSPAEPYAGQAADALKAAEKEYRAELVRECGTHCQAVQAIADELKFGDALASLASCKESLAGNQYFVSINRLDELADKISKQADREFKKIKIAADTKLAALDFDAATKAYGPVLTVFGMPALITEAQNEIKRIAEVRKAKEAEELARIKKRKAKADDLAAKRQYAQAMAEYKAVLPQIQLPSVKKQIQGSIVLLEAAARMKQNVIAYVNRFSSQGGLALQEIDPSAGETEVLVRADEKQFQLSDREQPDFKVPLPWHRLSFGVIEMLAERAADSAEAKADILALHLLEATVPSGIARRSAGARGEFAAVLKRYAEQERENQAAALWARLEAAGTPRLKRRLALKLKGEFSRSKAYNANKEVIEKAAIIVVAAVKPGIRRPAGKTFPVSREHPRLFGSRARLKQLARERSSAFQKMVAIARRPTNYDHTSVFSMALACAINEDAALGKAVVKRVQKYIHGPIRVGHETFGHDLAMCALAYDLCHEYWTDQERKDFFAYMNKTIDANVNSETGVFHNGYYGYKNWGIGMACYATYYENDKAQDYLARLMDDLKKRAAPAQELAGEGGSWAEGHYCHYFMYYWLVFCEAARLCEGVDLYALAPKFYAQRAIASIFEHYPGVHQYQSRRPIPRGDGGGRTFGGHRWNILAMRRILCNYYADDPVHQIAFAYGEQHPDITGGQHDYQDFLWYDNSIPKGKLDSFRLSHIARGPGNAFARSSWKEDATYLFFKAGDRFTAHQHLDNGHFLIYKHSELAGDGGHYDAFGSNHDVNYHLRSIAHSTLLVYDKNEKWPGIRAGNVQANDGGQHHNFPHHNGDANDAAAFKSAKAQHDIADFLAFEDTGKYVYMAADITRSYASNKVGAVTRQIVFVRPDTIVIFDRVQARNASYKKTWTLQALKKPVPQGENMLVIANGPGKLFVQTLLPQKPQVNLAFGANLYKVDGKVYRTSKDTGPAPECRIEISPSKPSEMDVFLHVLTAAGSGTKAVAPAALDVKGSNVTVAVPGAQITFSAAKVGGSITAGGSKKDLAKTIVADY